jgi:hypothetical protein
MNAGPFLLATLSLAILGGGAAFHPSLRHASLPARAAAAMGFGAVLLTLAGMLLTAAGVRWSVPALAAIPLAVSLAAGFWWRRRPAVAMPPMTAGRAARWTLVGAGGVSLALLCWALVSGSATSVDYLFFWGVKAARFADVRGVDVGLLRWPFFVHAVVDYPPLVPIVQAFGAIAAGELPWRTVPLTSLFWVAAAAPLLRSLLRRRLDGDSATAVTAFWIAAMSASVTTSLSGANAEAPLLFFESIAVAALLTEDAASSRFLPAWMLAGAVLTKVEGTVGAILIVLGAAAHDVLERRPALLRRSAGLALPPAAALSAWFLFQHHFGLRPGFRGHGGFFALHFDHVGTVLSRLPLALEAGTFGLSWLLPLVLLIAARPTPGRFLPAFALSAGLLAFLIFDYLHDRENPAIRISWTAPRVSQPALSALILASGLASFDPNRRRRSSTKSDTASVPALTAAP